MKILFFSLGDLVDRQRHRRGGNVENHVDAILIIPLARDGRADVGLVLVVGRDDLDLDAFSFGRLEVLGCQAARRSPSLRRRCPHRCPNGR
jgi:hypothetical protein